jgi:hypothetical protein
VAATFGATSSAAHASSNVERNARAGALAQLVRLQASQLKRLRHTQSVLQLRTHEQNVPYARMRAQALRRTA